MSFYPICEFTGLQRLFCPPSCPLHGAGVPAADLTDTERQLLAGQASPVVTITELERRVGRPLPQYRLRTVERRGPHQVVVEELWAVERPRVTVCDDSHQRPPGAQLCHACFDTLEWLLGDVPAMVEQLQLAARKGVRFVAHGTPPAAVDQETGQVIEESPLPWNEAARRALARLRDALPSGHGPVVAASRWALCNLQDLDQRGLLVQLTAAMSRAHAVIERPRDVAYVGRCPQCSADLYAARGGMVRCYAPLDLATEQWCEYSATWDQHLARVVQASDDRLLTVSELVVALGLSRDQVKNLTRRMEGSQLQRPHLYGHEIVTQTVTVYRLGDVRDEAIRRRYLEGVAS